MLVSQGFQPCLQSLYTSFNVHSYSEDAPFDENPSSDIEELANTVNDLVLSIIDSHHGSQSGFP